MPASGQEIGLRHDDDEFLAAKSSDEVDAAHAVKRSVGKVSKHAIPHDVAVRVVDEFEVIDVEQQDILFAFQPRSVWQARGYLSHRGDRPTYPEPGERLLAVTASEHPIGATGGLEFGIVAIPVEHQVRGAVDVQVREHRIS